MENWGDCMSGKNKSVNSGRTTQALLSYYYMAKETGKLEGILKVGGYCVGAIYTAINRGRISQRMIDSFTTVLKVDPRFLTGEIELNHDEKIDKEISTLGDEKIDKEISTLSDEKIDKEISTLSDEKMLKVIELLIETQDFGQSNVKKNIILKIKKILQEEV